MFWRERYIERNDLPVPAIPWSRRFFPSWYFSKVNLWFSVSGSIFFNRKFNLREFSSVWPCCWIRRCLRVSLFSCCWVIKLTLKCVHCAPTYTFRVTLLNILKQITETWVWFLQPSARMDQRSAMNELRYVFVFFKIYI